MHESEIDSSGNEMSVRPSVGMFGPMAGISWTHSWS